MHKATVGGLNSDETVSFINEEISVKLPAKEKYGGLLRLTVMGIGIRLDCTFDQIDDLKLATNEAFLLLLKNINRTTNSIEFKYLIDNEKVVVVVPLKNVQIEEQSMSIFIINGVSDGIEYRGEGESKEMFITKFINRGIANDGSTTE